MISTIFLSTLSLRRATGLRWTASCASIFLSTLSLRRATCLFYMDDFVIIDFYPRSPCGERPKQQQIASRSTNFYPRSPCGERHTKGRHAGRVKYFYPRSPCGERRTNTRTTRWQIRRFLSTLSLRRATAVIRQFPSHARFLSTLSLRRATVENIRHKNVRGDFYPRSPCGERQRGPRPHKRR